MPARNNALKERLSRSREINISVIGRKTGRTITIPVWFVLEDGKFGSCKCNWSDIEAPQRQRVAREQKPVHPKRLHRPRPWKVWRVLWR
jgi:hypothetical protein